MRIILASQSPRRKFLLEQMGLEFDTIPSKFDEYFDESRSPEEIVQELGLGKALDVAKDNPEAIVIGSDVIVVCDGKQLGKPESVEHAKELLRKLSGRKHYLVASIAVVCLSKNFKKTAVKNAEVTFGELDEEFIAKYVATGTTMDKAGGYAIQSPMMKGYIVDVKGSYDSILGMPTDLLARLLTELDIHIAPAVLNFDEIKGVT